MKHHRFCDDCWMPLRGDSDINLCWDCQRLRIVRNHPEQVVKDPALVRLAFENGIIIDQTKDGVSVREIFAYEDKNEEWRNDLNKINIRYKSKHGRKLPFDAAWDKAARASQKRTAAKYPSDNLDIIKRKGGKDYIGV